MECPFKLPVRLNKKGHFVCGEGESYRDLTPRLSMSSKHKLYIVQAINSHEKLVKALQYLVADHPAGLLPDKPKSLLKAAEALEAEKKE